ncbi:hypothetical protein [Dietzia sp. CH92]|uniref:hypothetical protein n=1 Tax=Dietzia sp. CH92 TaxID=3051823 RepID=UPI0028D20722|nr:hypothetical protein [Dietzia sp. CH92]
MGEGHGRRAAADAAISGATMAAWYALPDVVGSRRARGWVKAGLLLANVGVAVWSARSDDDDDDSVSSGRDTTDAEVDLSGIAQLAAVAPVIDADALGLTTAEPGRAARIRATITALAAVTVLGALGVAGTVAAERAIFRWGERRAARGVRGAHTRTGVVAGVATGAAIWLLERKARSTGG